MTDESAASGRHCEVEVLDDFDKDVAQRFAAWCKANIRERELLHVALAGGSTPKRVYQAIARSPVREMVDFAAIHFYQGDERMVPPEHRDSNWGMAQEALLNPAKVPSRNRRRMRGESPDPREAASRYGEVLRFRLPDREGLPVFDLILLGVGTDGHTASLFPDTPALTETRRLVVANPVPRLQTTRLTLTFPVINAAREIWILARGAAKKDIVRRAVEDRDESLPVTRVASQWGRCVWLLDSAAAAALSSADGLAG